MYSFFYNLYYYLKRVQNNSSNKSFRKKIAIKIIGYIEAYYNLYVAKQWKKHPSHKYGITRKKRKQKIIVSLTSYPKRIQTAWIAIESLLRQSMKPDEIILWLAREQFPNNNDVPLELRNQQKRGLTIRFCKDLKSHKKYFYTMQDYPNDLVILVDDDTFFTRDLIQKLYYLHKKYPEEIVCMTPAMIDPDYSANPENWRRVHAKEKVEHSFLAQPFTGQGTLYPPHSISESVFDEENMMKYCPYADDMWLKFFSLAIRTKTTAVYPYRGFPVTIYGTGESSLWYINGPIGGENDRQWQNLIREYPNTFKKISKLPRI